MTNTLTWSVGLLIAVVVVFGSGVVLTRRGRPYGTGLLNVHKLVDLVAVAAIGVLAYRGARVSSLSAFEWAAVTGTALVVVALFATGAVASASKTPPSWAMWVHRLSPWLGLALAGITVYLRLGP